MSPGVNPQTALHLFNVGVSSTLTYGMDVHLYTLINLNLSIWINTKLNL